MSRACNRGIDRRMLGQSQGRWRMAREGGGGSTSLRCPGGHSCRPLTAQLRADEKEPIGDYIEHRRRAKSCHIGTTRYMAEEAR